MTEGLGLELHTHTVYADSSSLLSVVTVSFQRVDAFAPEIQSSSRHCDLCGKVFRGEYNKSNLKQHMSIHRGEKPFKCPLCPHRSNRKNNLKVHVLTVHPQFSSQFYLEK